MMKWNNFFDVAPSADAKGDFLVWIDNGRTAWAGIYTYSEESWSMIGVTHWMPLPPAPEVEQ